MAEENDFLETRLSSEYSIVQDKIDKIGAFRFTIRGWTVTLITATILAVASAKLLSPYSLLFLIVPLIIFHLIEEKQNRNQQVLEDRAFDIEAELRRIRPDDANPRTSSIDSPRIAHSLKESRIKVGDLREYIADPDRWFYWVLGLFVLLAVGFLVCLEPKARTHESVDVYMRNEVNPPTATAQPTIAQPTPAQPTPVKPTPVQPSTGKPAGTQTKPNSP